MRTDDSKSKSPVDRTNTTPLASAHGSQLSEAMMAWSKAWKLDGDLCRCRKCNRAIIISRTDEAMHHAAGCSQAHLIAPWQDLRSRIPANGESSDGATHQKGTNAH